MNAKEKSMEYLKERYKVNDNRATVRLWFGDIDVALDIAMIEAKKEVIDVFDNLLANHRLKTVITCPEDCFCWELDNTITSLSKSSKRSKEISP